MVENKMAKVTALSGAGVKLLIDGEGTATDKVYTKLKTYSATINDRVVLVPISGTYIVIGEV